MEVESAWARRDREVTESMLPSINTPDKQAEAFPVLTPAQIDRIRPYGTARTVRAGEILFEMGQLGMPCFVVLSGKLDIVMRISRRCKLNLVQH